ncbi:MAG: Xaa-Pro peptidase family protein [Candidatus Omnitrophica bacterium]|nr:Xaa-Pro peptidase family protein [Candidatus Omnitrophota bacterium]
MHCEVKLISPINLMNYSARQKKLITLMDARSLDLFLVRKKQNIFYLTGARGDDAALIVSRKGNALVTDGRYKEEYKKTAKNCKINIVKNKGLREVVSDLCAAASRKKIGFEPDNLSYTEYTALKKKLKAGRLTPAGKLVESLRAIKDKDEIMLIKKACRGACRVMDYAERIIKPGITEKYLKNRLNRYIIEKNMGEPGFDTIVASGKNSAMPHAAASAEIIKKGKQVIIDLGTLDQGYNSDLTRTIFLGRINHKYREVYGAVLGAQKKAIERVRPGVRADHIDNISRQYISYKRMGRYFIHSLGHGIGLETHEIPRLSGNNDIVLRENMVVTIEPGIYIPGWGGVRIEDVVLITKNGCEILTVRSKKT